MTATVKLIHPKRNRLITVAATQADIYRSQGWRDVPKVVVPKSPKPSEVEEK